ncbi:hypothetical protein EYS14_10825 [Alteromonadaceae bacterium M269]|nr:hypothetical protein EYS14_10825 [Alteromonadaceae bacterium M269]
MDSRKMIGLALLVCAFGMFLFEQDFTVGFLGLSQDFWTGFLLAIAVTVPTTLFIFYLISKFISKKHAANEKGDVHSKWGKSTSIGDGYWFFFEHEGDEIVLHRSTYMGIETVYLNDNPVSSKNNMIGLKRTHEFMLKGKEIRVVTDFVNIIGYRYECSLYVGLTKYHSETKGLAVANGQDVVKSVFLTLCISLFAGIVSGGLIYFLVYLIN